MLRHLISAALVAGAVLAAGCSSGGGGSGGVAAVASGSGHAGSTAPAQPLTQQQSDQDMVDFARCMRGHGVQMPDPVHRSGHAGLSIEMPDRNAVTVPVSPSLPPAAVGEAVSIVLPSQARVPGTITAAGPSQLTVAPRGATGTGENVAVQVALAVQAARDVLAVPVAALLALAGGGYGLEIVAPSGAHHLVAVTAGLFAGGQVQVSGAGIAPGTKVVTAQ